MQRLTLIASFIAVFSTPAHGQNVAGLGAVLCREVLPVMNEKAFQAQLFAWATGFLTGVNLTNYSNGRGQREFRGTAINMDVVLGEVRAYCGRHPDRPVVAAIEPMYQSFRVGKTQ